MRTAGIQSTGNRLTLAISAMKLPIVSARIPTKDFEAVNLRAEKENVSRQAVVLKALEAYLKTPVHN